MESNQILYGDIIKYQNEIGKVKEIKGSIARIKLKSKKKSIMVSVESLIKIEDVEC